MRWHKGCFLIAKKRKLIFIALGEETPLFLDIDLYVRLPE